jgi:hypothetical protein
LLVRDLKILVLIFFYRLTYNTVLYDEILNNIIAEHNIVVVNSIEDIYRGNITTLQQLVDLEKIIDVVLLQLKYKR